MKKILSISIFLFIVALSVQAQIPQADGKLIPKIPFRIKVGQLTTTVIVFPFAVKNADRGMANVSATKVAGIENVIELKAINPFQDTTNLHVYTADGRVLPFIVTFKSLPDTTTYDWSPNTSSPNYTPIRLQNASINDKELSDLVKEAWNERSFMNRRAKGYRMKLSLKSLYYKGDIILAKLRLQNNTELSYQAGWVHLYIADRTQTKRSSIQQLTIPLLYSDPLPYIQGEHYTEWIIAFPKKTIANKKKLMLEVQEKEGGRNFILEIQNKDLFKAKML